MHQQFPICVPFFPMNGMNRPNYFPILGKFPNTFPNWEIQFFSVSVTIVAVIGAIAVLLFIGCVAVNSGVAVIAVLVHGEKSRT